jgi:hypothetical protein
MYLQITSACYTHCTSISNRSKESAMLEGFKLFTDDMKIISESMTAVCPFFHAAITLKNEDQFQPGKNVFNTRKFVLFSKFL